MNLLVGNTLTVRVVSREENIPLGSLLLVLSETLAMLKGIDEETSAAGRRTLTWRVSEVTYNSPLLLTIVGEPTTKGDYNPGVALQYLEGLGRLERGEEPSGAFTEFAMERAKKIAMVRNDGIASVVFSAPDRSPVEPTQHLAANVDVILKKRYRGEVTTLDGLLMAIDVHKDYTFKIYDQATGRRTACTFPEELLREAALSIRERVAVTGLARYDRHGHPASMKVNSMRRLRRAAELPRFGPGEAIDITGGVPSEVYVRRMRDAE